MKGCRKKKKERNKTKQNKHRHIVKYAIVEKAIILFCIYTYISVYFTYSFIALPRYSNETKKPEYITFKINQSILEKEGVKI